MQVYPGLHWSSLQLGAATQLACAKSPWDWGSWQTNPLFQHVVLSRLQFLGLRQAFTAEAPSPTTRHSSPSSSLQLQLIVGTQNANPFSVTPHSSPLSLHIKSLQLAVGVQNATFICPSPATRHSNPSFSLQFNLLQSEIGPQTALLTFEKVIIRHSWFGSSQASRSHWSGEGVSTHIALPSMTTHTNPSEHSSSLQSWGAGATRIGTQRTTGDAPFLSWHCIPFSHLTSSQLVGGSWGMHLARGPRAVCRTSQNDLSGGQRTCLQSVGGCGWGDWTHFGSIYCLQLGLFFGQVVGATVFMQVSPAGHAFWAQVRPAQRLVTSFLSGKRKNVALHSPWQASTLHSVFRKRGHLAPSQGSAAQTTGLGHMAFCALAPRAAKSDIERSTMDCIILWVRNLTLWRVADWSVL